MRIRGHPARPWRPLRPVPGPDTGNPHLDLVQAAIEAHLYPSGDLGPSPGRPIATHQLELLARGRREGMDDQGVGAFLSANLMGGGNPVYRRVGRELSWAGTVCLAGRFSAPDVMGRRPFAWTLSTTLARETDPDPPAMERSGGAALQVVRRVLSVPWKALPRETESVRWESEQAVLF